MSRPAKPLSTWRWVRLLVPPFLVYGSAAILCVSRGLQELPMGQALLTIAGGWFAWTLVEYLLHRFAFHEEPGKPVAQKHDIHWIHHRNPTDAGHIVTSLFLTLPVAALFFGLFWLIGWGHPAVWPFYGGFAIGYLAYEAVHLAVHQIPQAPLRFLRPLWRHHYWHHFRTPDRYYGVTTRLWDWIFGTA